MTRAKKSQQKVVPKPRQSAEMLNPFSRLQPEGQRLARKFEAEGLNEGQCFGSKSGYRERNPGHVFVPNARIVKRNGVTLWWGHLDLSLDKARIVAVAQRLRIRLFVLYEDYEFYVNEAQTEAKMEGRAIWHTGLGSRLSPREKFVRKARAAL